MEMGIVSRETKQRFEELEAQRTKLETDIIKQEIQEEIITREQVVEWLKEMKRLDLSLDDSKRKLVDTFVNSVYLYDDKVVIIFNCREGASTLALPLDDTSACMRIGEPITANRIVKRIPLARRFALFLGKLQKGVTDNNLHIEIELVKMGVMS